MITELAQTPECRLGHFESLLVSVWSSRLTVASLDLLEAHHRALAAKYGKVTFLSVVVGAAENPPPEARERMKKTTEEMMKLRRGNLIVVQAKGLGAILTRSFLAAMSFMSTEKIGVFKTLGEAVAEIRAIKGQDAALVAATALEADLVAFVDGHRGK